MIDPGTGVLETQRKLAEIVEMIHTAQVLKIFCSTHKNMIWFLNFKLLQSIHQSVVNLPVNIAEEEDEELRTMLAQLEYGNKISILGCVPNN